MHVNNYTGIRRIYIEKKTGKGVMSCMHYHNSHEIYYVIKGEREYFIEDAFFKVAEGDLVFIPQALLHRTAGKGATRYLIDFSDNILRDHFKEETLRFLLPNDRPFVFHPAELEKPHLDKHFSDMLTASEEESAPDQKLFLLASYLYQILFTIRTQKNVYIPQNAANALIEAILKYINENFYRIECIEQIASEFYISKYHLCHLFQKQLGIPVMGYLNTVRIKHACTLLTDSADMTEIAVACGFNSPSYFSKVFKKEKGIPPSQYRKAMKSITQKGELYENREDQE